jgi:hypothetical protein
MWFNQKKKCSKRQYLSFFRLLVSPPVMLTTELSVRLAEAACTAVVGVLVTMVVDTIRGMWYLVVGMLPRTESSMKVRKFIPTSIKHYFLGYESCIHFYAGLQRKILFSVYETDKIIAFAIGKLLRQKSTNNRFMSNLALLSYEGKQITFYLVLGRSCKLPSELCFVSLNCLKK